MAEQYFEKERNEIITYGIERGKIILTSLIVVIVLGTLFGIFVQSIIFLVTFCLIRRYAGGYHADTQKRCYIISFAVIILIFVYIAQIEHSLRIGAFVQVICLIIILIMAPIDNDNRKLNVVEKKCYGKRTKITALVIHAVYVFLYSIRYWDIATQ